jgi:hypothetical protein
MKLHKFNDLSFDLSLSLLGFGFSYKDYYLSFNISNLTNFRFGYPRSLIELHYLNWDLDAIEPRDIDLKGFSFNIVNYTSIGIAASKKIYKELSLGLRLKYLKGTAHLNTPKNGLDLVTTEEPIFYNFLADYRLNLSFPVQIEFDEEGYVIGVSADNAFSNVVSDFIFNKNRGVAFDLGGVYEYDRNITLSASIVDLGFIYWKSNSYSFQTEGDILYRGLNLDNYASGDESEMFEELLDSIQNAFHMDNSNQNYFYFLPLKIFIGGVYGLNEKIDLGVTTRTQIYFKKVHPQLAINLITYPFKFLTFSLNYSIMDNKYNQLGYGLVIGNKGFQFYLVSEHIPFFWTREADSGVILPYNARSINFQFGFNIIFGCKYKEDKKDICPVYW